MHYKTRNFRKLSLQMKNKKLSRPNY